MICGTCNGSGNLFNRQNGSNEWWPCPACGGCGVRVMFGPPTFGRLKEPHKTNPTPATPAP